KSLVVNWIDGNKTSYNENNLPYNFKLILRGSQDGFSRAVFEKKCCNIEQTVVIMRLKETKELVGGYNPVCWNIKEKSPDKSYWIKTDKSFIFKIDENQIKDSILSRVKDLDYAIRHWGRIDEFTLDDIRFHERLMSFCDLDIRNSINNEPYCYYNCKSYENDLNLTTKKKYVHL